MIILSKHLHALSADGLIGIGIATTAVGLLVGGIAAIAARKK
jgi:fission 1 protein